MSTTIDLGAGTTTVGGERAAGAAVRSTGPDRSGTAEMPRTRAWHRAADHWAVIVAVLGVAALHVLSINGTRFTADEGTYYSQALSFITDGSLSPYTYWYDHPPVGWIQLAPFIGLAKLLLSSWAPAIVGRAIMVVFAAATATLIYAVGRSLRLSRPAALAATLLWGLSPLAAQMSGQLFLDNVGMPWLLASLWLVLNRRRDIFLHLLAGVTLAVAVLTKETYVLALPGIGLALVTSAHRSNRVFSLVGFAFAFTTTCLLYPLLAINRGELLPGKGHVSLWDGIVWQLGSRDGSGLPFTPGTDANMMLGGWLSVDPVLPVVGVLACALSLVVPRLRPVGVVAAVMIVVAVRPSGYLPAMYILGLLPFFALAIAGLLDAAVARLRRPAVRSVLGLVLACSVAASLAGPWLPGWRSALTTDQNVTHRQTVDAVTRTIPPDAAIITDDVLWNDLVAAGRDADGWSGPIWFPKYELDPVGGHKNGVDGWRDVDYVVSTNAMRSTLDDSRPMRELHAHSVVVERIGTGGDRIDIRRVEKDS